MPIWFSPVIFHDRANLGKVIQRVSALFVNLLFIAKARPMPISVVKRNPWKMLSFQAFRDCLTRVVGREREGSGWHPLSKQIHRVISLDTKMG